LKRLRTLLMAECDGMTVASLQHFAQTCPISLEVVDLSSSLSTTRVTYDSNVFHEISTYFVVGMK
jgi:hypothetical protein